MSTESIEAKISPARQPSNRKAARTRALMLMGAIALLISIRVSGVLPWVNYYSFVDESQWVTYYHPYNSHVYESAKVMPLRPGYTFKGGMTQVQYYQPAPTKSGAIWYALLHPPVEIGYGPFNAAWSDSESKFFDAHERRIARPPASEMPFYVLRPHLRLQFVRYGPAAPIRSSDVVGSWCEYRRLTDAKWSDIVAKEAIVKVAPGYRPAGKNGATKCFWNERSEGFKYQEVIGTLNSSSVEFDDCWNEPHSVFYNKAGKRDHGAPSNDTRGDYVMNPHLTLLYEKRTGKLAGGYWWGEFHDRFD